MIREKTKDKIDRNIYDYFKAQIDKGHTKTEATQLTKLKFRIGSRVTVWSIRKRVEKRIAEKAQDQIK